MLVYFVQKNVIVFCEFVNISNSFLHHFVFLFLYLFNKDGCWDGLIQWINKSVELKMLKDFPNTLFVDNSIKNIIEKIKDNEF